MSEKRDNCPCVENCPLVDAMALIGGKWKIQIICALYNDGPIRFNALKRKITGISNVMLVNSLREMEDDGLVIREQYMEIPPRVEYRITDTCLELIPILNQLGNWGYKVKGNKDKKENGL